MALTSPVDQKLVMSRLTFMIHLVELLKNKGNWLVPSALDSTWQLFFWPCIVFHINSFY